MVKNIYLIGTLLLFSLTGSSQAQSGEPCAPSRDITDPKFKQIKAEEVFKRPKGKYVLESIKFFVKRDSRAYDITGEMSGEVTPSAAGLNHDIKVLCNNNVEGILSRYSGSNNVPYEFSSIEGASSRLFNFEVSTDDSKVIKKKAGIRPYTNYVVLTDDIYNRSLEALYAGKPKAVRVYDLPNYGIQVFLDRSFCANLNGGRECETDYTLASYRFVADPSLKPQASLTPAGVEAVVNYYDEKEKWSFLHVNLKGQSVKNDRNMSYQIGNMKRQCKCYRPISEIAGDQYRLYVAWSQRAESPIACRYTPYDPQVVKCCGDLRIDFQAATGRTSQVCDCTYEGMYRKDTAQSPEEIQRTRHEQCVMKFDDLTNLFKDVSANSTFSVTK